ncbi:hypothetical protein FQN54_007127 [Arachnomyces sp. PD_36]|nr:hypothetical protein FQN54_007127 [Arachnomyces sp. PD_36]
MEYERISDPYCIACGGLVGFEDIYGHRSRTRSIDDIKLDPKNPLEWGSFYRAVFQPSAGSRFRLSGTGRYDGSSRDASHRDFLKVVWDRDSNNVHRPQVDNAREVDWFIGEINFLDSDNEQVYPHGYIVHAHCWILIERMIGPEVENNLELFLEICRERFHENPYDIHEYRDLESSEPTSQPTYRWWNPLQSASSLDPSRHHPDVQKDPRKSIPLRDPLNTAEITTLINHSAQNKARETIKRKTRKWSSTISDPSSSSTSGQAKSPNFYQVTQLPCDIMLLILDNLSHHTDIRNALIAFDWSPPDIYWKSRVPKDLIFELQDGNHWEDDLDWKFLGLGIVKLLEQPSLRNRKRVLRLVDEIGRRFWERMAVRTDQSEIN